MKELELYEKQLTRALDCPRPLRRQLLERFRAMAQDFTNGTPDAEWAEVEAFLGPPGELACTMLEQEDQLALERYRTRKKRIQYCVAGGLVAVLLLSVAGLIYVDQTRKNPIIVTETLIIYETEDSV